MYPSLSDYIHDLVRVSVISSVSYMPELTFRLEEGPFHDISLYRLHFHMNIMYKEKLLCFTP